MRRLIATAAAVLVATALMAAPVGAITNGTPDGNAHASVGAMLYREPGAAGYTIGCTGTLIGKSPAVFLTAGHCVFYIENFLPAGTTYTVSFDTDLQMDADGLVHPAKSIAVTGWDLMPSYLSPASDHRDVAVLYLASAPAGVRVVALPPLGAARDAVGQSVVSVGYGWNSLDRSYASPTATHTSDGLRMAGPAWVSGVSPNWLTAHSGPASTCYHDSGGPQFADGVLVSITTSGDPACVNVQKNQRLDLADVQEWLGEQLD